MPDYKLSKIYKIESQQTREVYYGSTTQSLLQRFSSHKSDYKRWLNGCCSYTTSFKILVHDDSTITLVENFACDNFDDLIAREAYYIKNDENCINKIIPGRTREEYVADNPEMKKKAAKKYYQKNKILLNEKYKKKYADSEIIECECGSSFNKICRRTHLKSKCHTNFLKAINLN